MSGLWKSICMKLKNRMPGGELYEVLRMQKKLLEDEKNPLFRDVMAATYRRKKNLYFRGGVRRCQYYA